MRPERGLKTHQEQGQGEGSCFKNGSKAAPMESYPVVPDTSEDANNPPLSDHTSRPDSPSRPLDPPSARSQPTLESVCLTSKRRILEREGLEPHAIQDILNAPSQAKQDKSYDPVQKMFIKWYEPRNIALTSPLPRDIINFLSENRRKRN